MKIRAINIVVLFLGQNSIIIVAGANLLLEPSELKSVEETISQSKIVVCQLEVKKEVTLAALKLAKKYGGNTLCKAVVNLIQF